MPGSLGKNTGKIAGPGIQTRINQQQAQETAVKVADPYARSNQGTGSNGWPKYASVSDIEVPIQPPKQENDVVMGDRRAK